MRHPLEPGAAEMRALADAAVEFAVRFVAAREDAPASDLEGVRELLGRPELRDGPPEEGRDLAHLLDVIEHAAAKGFDTAGPGYLAFVPGGGLFAAAVGDFLACVLNRFVNLAMPAPALAQLEAGLLRWLCGLVGFAQGAQGILTSGGSMANLSAIVTARAACAGEQVARAVVYVSAHGHASVTKAARLAGVPGANVRVLPCTPDLRLDAAAVVAAVRADRTAGLVPCCLVANAGTTDTGTVDPLPELAAVAGREGLWLHVDAAYGGFFLLTERGRARLAGVERADSVTLDPHKGLFLPYGTGCLLVRDGAQLRAAHSGGGSHYLQDLETDLGVPDFADYSPELSRDFRGLRLWLPLQLHGVAAFRAALDEKLDLAAFVHEALAADPSLEVLGAPHLSTVAFRVRRDTPAEGDAATAELLARVNGERRVMLSSTVVGGRLTLRVCILSHRTHRARIEEAVDAIRRHAADLSAAA